MKLTKLTALCALIPTLLLAGCGTNTTPPVETNEQTTTAPTEDQATTEPATRHALTIGVMPAVDTAPIYLAEKAGYFETLGLDLEVVLFNNAQERQTALQTNSIDGALTDLIAVATNVNGGFDLKATTLTDGMFPVLVREGYEETKDIKVAMMEVSVSNYLIDEWLAADYNIEKVFINDIPARLEMIKSGQVDMGLFPEPMATNATADGILTKRVYAPEDGICPNVMAFTEKAIAEKSEAIQLFHQGVDQSVADILANEEIARDILIEVLGLNPAIKDDILLPVYTYTHLPADAYLQKMIDWVKLNLNESLDVTPAMLVDTSFTK